MKILTIIICTITGREDQFDYIYKRLCEQRTNLFMKDDIEILVLKDDCTMSVGEKRNKGYEMAKGSSAKITKMENSLRVLNARLAQVAIGGTSVNSSPTKSKIFRPGQT